MVSIIDIEHIGYAYKEKLASIGIRNTEILIEIASTPKGRQSIEEAADISNDLLLKWIRSISLLKIDGIDQDYSNVLIELGINSCRELSQQDPKRLKKDIQSLVIDRNIRIKLPTFLTIKSWIDEAAILSNASA